MTGLRRSYISDMERGARNPTLSAVERIAVALGVAPAELVRLPDGVELTPKIPGERG
jgi:transcriptional regulator with XRE-family HTH domain